MQTNDPRKENQTNAGRRVAAPKGWLMRKYPSPQTSRLWKDCLVSATLVFLILLLFQPFGIAAYSGSKVLLCLSFAAITFFCHLVYGFLVFGGLSRHVTRWTVLHQALCTMGLILFIGVCNYQYYAILAGIYFQVGPFLLFLYWTFLIGVVISVVFMALSYQHLLRTRMEALLEVSEEEQEGMTITLHDQNVHGEDLTVAVNDLLYMEARKNNVAVYYLKDGATTCRELRSTLTALLETMEDCHNLIQCHRSFIVNVNKITAARGNSNGYQLTLGSGSSAIVPVSRTYVPLLRSFVG